jgi:REP element-mobilizing transposase RayT
MEPLAFHLTWTAYGTWLHGDERSWVESGVPGIQAPDAARASEARALLAEAPVVLDDVQRQLVEATIREVCQFRGWVIHALSVRTNHIHLIVTAAGRHPDEVMKQFKAWCSRKLSDQAGLTKKTSARAGRRRWFTEGGSTKWINEPAYLENAIRYVSEGQ